MTSVPPRLAAAGCVLLAPLWLALPARSAVLHEHTFRYAPERFALTAEAGFQRVTVVGGVSEAAPGWPDLPAVAERVDLPPFEEIERIEVLEARWRPFGPKARVAPAQRMVPGLDPAPWSGPDPVAYARAAWLPERPVELGAQGFMRGQHLAYLTVRPVRWNPASGALEVLEELRVGLVRRPTRQPGLARERVVPQWEDAAALPRVPTREGVAALGAGPPRPEPGGFKPTQLPSLLGSPVAYVIITNDALAPEFQRLADWKTESGLPAVVRTTSFIQQQYPFGSDLAERVRMFIRDAYQRWGTKWVLLGGDVAVVPTRIVRTTFYGGEDIASDMYYSSLEGNWNADGDSLFGEGYFTSSNPGDQVDLFPEVYVGRASVTTLADAQLSVDRAFQYMRTPVGDYEDKVIFFAEVLFPQNWSPGDFISLDGAALAQEVLPYICTNPFWKVTKLYENWMNPAYCDTCYGCPKQETVQAVKDSLHSGYNFACHIGHGYRNTMSVGNGTLDNGDALAIQNGNRLTALYAINCTSNAIDFESIGEAFMLAPGGGMIANIGSTRFDFPTAGRLYQREFFKLVFQDSVTALGEAQARQKIPYVGFATYDGVHRWTQTTLIHLGDPELRLWSGTPRTLAVTHAGAMPISDSSFTVHVEVGSTPLYGARVTLYKTADVFVTGTTDGAGDALLAVRPGSLGPMKVTVTGVDCRPYQAVVNVLETADAALTNLPNTVDDDMSPPSVGNDDGLVDAGEVVELLVPVVNRGGALSTGVTGTLSTTDPLVTITGASASYGNLPPAASASGSEFVVDFPLTLDDQREVPFELHLLDAEGRHFLADFQITVHAPELDHFKTTVVDSPGDGDGVPEPGETIHYTVQLKNLGTGFAQGVYARLRSLNANAVVLDSTSTLGDMDPGSQLAADEFVFQMNAAPVVLELQVYDTFGSLWKRSPDLVRPPQVNDVLGLGGATSITLTWAKSSAADLRGYNIHRANQGAGPYLKVNPNPTGRIAYYLDTGLAPLTRYYYYITAVDSSGNESVASVIDSTSTNPPMHTGWPVPMGRNTPSSVALSDFDHDYPGLDIVAGADVLYLWHADATYPVDADGTSRTSGDFTIYGRYYAAGPSIGDLDDDGVLEIVAPSWDSLKIFVFEPDGSFQAGFPALVGQSIWSSVALGDLDNDGTLELVSGSNGAQVFALRSNGAEWMDGDNNPATFGIFKALGSPFNYGTPALGDLDNDGTLDIVYGSFDLGGNEGKLFAWRPNGTNLPGFPVNLGTAITCSPALGDLDNDGVLEIVIVSARDSLYVYRNDGTLMPGSPGWPQRFRATGTSKQPSPALADMNGDGYLDIVAAGTDGSLKVFDRNGAVLPGWSNVRYSIFTSGASESSPVVSDITGDGVPDVVVGGEDGRLHLFSGTGVELAGSPIQLAGEIRGTPSLCDCDHDGLAEIVLAGWDKNLYVWDYPGAFSPGQDPPWPTFHHDERRTGRKSAPVFVGVDPRTESPPPAAVALSLPVPNPARSGVRFSYAVPAAAEGSPVELSVFDLSGRRVALLHHGAAKAGRHDVAWNLRGESGDAVQSGVYFALLKLGSAASTRKVVVVR